jgi:hypothetical protein
MREKPKHSFRCGRLRLQTDIEHGDHKQADGGCR